MANNRMYIREKRTGKIIMLAKHLGGPWEVRPWGLSSHAEIIERLNNFFKEVQQELQIINPMIGPTTFEFVYEFVEPDSAALEL